MTVQCSAAAPLIQRVKSKWISEGVAINPGIFSETLQTFELRRGVRLPADLQEYFSAVNGMERGDMDKDGFTFLPLEDVKPVQDDKYANFGGIPDFRAIVQTLPDANDWYVIVDFLISSALYAIRLRADIEENPILLISDGTRARTIAASFQDFLHTYLTDSLSLY